MRSANCDRGTLEDLREPRSDFLADSDVVVVIYLHLHWRLILAITRCLQRQRA
jgi:hypothetical protein